jgi:hypothetical protein
MGGGFAMHLQMGRRGWHLDNEMLAERLGARVMGPRGELTTDKAATISLNKNTCLAFVRV